MRYVLFFLLAAISLAFQATVFSKLTIAGAKPDLLLIIAVFFAFIKGAKQGAAFGFAYGLLEDLTVGRFIGLNALSKAAVCYLIGLSEGKVYKENLLAPGLAILLASILNGLLVTVLLNIAGISLGVAELFWRTVVPAAIYNLGLAPLIYIRFYLSLTKGILR